jgi:phosphatidate cytidylyltransferase
LDWKNLGQRVAVAAVFAPLILYLGWIGGAGYMLLIEVIAVVGLLEFYRLAQHKQIHPNLPVGVLAGAAMAPLVYFRLGQGVWLLCIAAFVLLVITELFRRPRPESGPLVNVAGTLMGLIYVAGLLSFLLMLRELPRQKGSEYDHAGTWIAMLFLTTWICDTAAYFVGLQFGKHKLFERVSPKKTVEGAFGGLVFAVLAAVACYHFFVIGLQLRDAVIIGILIGTVGQMSDLVESLFKRDAGVKDSSRLIPGHGGMLDRFDSEMLVAPLVYFYLLAVDVG